LKIVIIDYSPESGKGKYRGPDNKVYGFRHQQIERMLPPGTLADLSSNGKITEVKTFWDKLKFNLKGR